MNCATTVAIFVFMTEPTTWALLAYRLPREPSTPRITVWRKLKRLGAVQMVDGLVALPADPRTVEAFDWLADEVVEAGGEAWTWRADAGGKQQERLLRQRMNEAASEEYRAVAEDAASLEDAQKRNVDRLRRELREIEARDYFGAKGRDQARRAVDRVGAKAGLGGKAAAR